MKRCRFLAFALCTPLLCASGVVGAQNAAEPPFTLKQIGANVWAAISNPKSQSPAGANTGFVIGDDGVAVIDTTLTGDAEGNFGTKPARQLSGAVALSEDRLLHLASRAEWERVHEHDLVRHPEICDLTLEEIQHRFLGW